MKVRRKPSAKSVKARAAYFGLLAVAGMFVAGAAYAIPLGQQDTGGAGNTNSNTFVLVPNTSVTVNNGSNARNCIIQLSAEAHASGTRVAVGYAVDSTNPASCEITGGPSSFHTGDLFEMHTALWGRSYA